MKRACFVLLVVMSLAACVVALDRQPNADYHARRMALAAKLNGGVALLFAPTEGPDEVHGFRQDDNFYYLTGLEQSGAALLIAPQAEPAPGAEGATARPYTEILFLPARLPMLEKFVGVRLGPDDPQAAQVTGFDRVDSYDKMGADLAAALKGHKRTVYTDLPSPGKTSLSEAPLVFFQRSNALPFASYEEVRTVIEKQRTFKDPGEIALIQKAIDASVAAQFAAMKAIKPGVNERDIAAVLRYEWARRGCERESYFPIVGSGLNSTVLHYSADTAQMQAGDVVVIDAACEYSMYSSDITRTMPVSGKFTARQREIYDIVLGAQQAAIAAFVSGKSNMKRDDPNSLWKVAREYIDSHGKDLQGKPLGQYFTHGLGHYVGLAVHDPNDYEVPFGPGSVFTIEPGIYIPEEKIGVRIEDTFYVDPSGKLINMSAALPHTADDVERAMRGK
ncbi:MAG: aminopeptidase P family protein [Acidobacteriales bacterium]|nr:aminopeptidase P family protein [Terriglobales bacterium]